MSDSQSRPAVVSSRDMLRSARLVRGLQHALEAAVALVVIASLAAFGAVHPKAQLGLWLGCLAVFALTLLRALALAGLRQRLGAHRIAFHSSGRWLVVEPHAADTALGWSIDLREPALPRGPLLLPGLVFLVLACLQLAAWPGSALLPLGAVGGTISLDPAETRRGITFVVALLALHSAAAAAFTHRPAWRRFRHVLAWTGAALALVALVQLASGTRRMYGVFESEEDGSPFGPFVNRDHFAGYMLLVVPIALGLLAAAWRGYARRVGERPNLRRRLVALSAPEGTAAVYAALPPLLAIGALLATTSRGGILAFVFALAIAAVGLRSRARGGTPGWVAALVFAGMALMWFGVERLEVRFARSAEDAPGRTVIWKESLAAMHGARWATGYGLGAFPEAVSRVPAWKLPAGATPWPAPAETALLGGGRVGFRAPADLPDLGWYREAHNDWVQLLVETGLPGLLVGLWAALAALAAARRDPWLFAALAGVLMHVFVDFDFQVPAIPALFVVLAASRR